MKGKSLFIALAMIVLGGSMIATSSCKKEKNQVIEVTGIELGESSVEMTVGTSHKLTATVLPENATEKGVVWESKDESIATVDQEGLVSAVKEGSTKIIVSTANGNFSAVCNVIIEKELVAVTSITLDKDVIELMAGSKYQFKATVLPDNATNKTLIWSSDDEQIAMVSSSGVVMALKEGAATIYVQSLDKKVSASCV